MNGFDRYVSFYDILSSIINIYHPKQIAELLELEDAGAPCRILDIGGGTGMLAQKILQLKPWHGLEFTILDPNLKMLARSMARSKKDGAHVKHFHGRGENMPFPSQFFDRAISTSTLHHVSSPQAVLCEAYRVLKPGGIMVMQEFNHAFFSIKALMLLDRLLTGNIQKIYPAQVHSWGEKAGFIKGQVIPCGRKLFFWKGLKPGLPHTSSK